MATYEEILALPHGAKFYVTRPNAWMRPWPHLPERVCCRRVYYSGVDDVQRYCELFDSKNSGDGVPIPPGVYEC